MSILGLKLPTDPRWVNLAEKELEEILVEMKSAGFKAPLSRLEEARQKLKAG